MTTDDRPLDELARDINATCRLKGDFTLRSGQRTDEYFDKYQFEGQPALLRCVAERIVPLLPEHVDLLGGLELGGVPITTMVSSWPVCPRSSCARRPRRMARVGWPRARMSAAGG